MTGREKKALERTEEFLKREMKERAIKAMRAPKCVCGREKRFGICFCSGCWNALPGGLQRGLYRLIGVGFEQAYENARVWLRAAKGIGA
jgi:hypothetical protein